MPSEEINDSKEDGEGAWVFLSHSHKDFGKVCEVRNELEKVGHRPLMFFLKCLENNDTRLPALIKEEIEARNWFILCDSPNAQASKWVQEEVTLVKAAKDKVFRTVDLTKRLDTQRHIFVELSKRATVYITYSQHDIIIANKIRQTLINHDYRIWKDSFEFNTGNDLESIRLAINDAINHGFVLVLLSRAANYGNDYKIHYALNCALCSQKNNVIPIIVSPLSPADIPREFQDTYRIKWFDFTTESFDEKMEELIHSLKTREME